MRSKENWLWNWIRNVDESDRSAIKPSGQADCSRFVSSCFLSIGSAEMDLKFRFTKQSLIESEKRIFTEILKEIRRASD